MRSPFPGMDPYLEERWSNVHPSLCFCIQEMLQTILPGTLRARAEERVLLENDDGEQKVRQPDVAIVDAPPFRPFSRDSDSVAVIEPVSIQYLPEPAKDRWVQIIDVTNGNRVVTVIEILSPWNKLSGNLNQMYRKKIREYEDADVNIVELDLLRGPRYLLRVQRDELPTDRRADYLYSVRRMNAFLRWDIYPMSLRERLPIVPVPLRPTDQEVTLDLQAVIDRIYLAGGHDDIDYTKPTGFALTADDLAWAKEQIATANRA